MTNTVLIGAAGSGTSFALITRIRASYPETKIVAIDSNPKHLVSSALFSDVYYQVPLVSDGNYLEMMSEILSREKATHFFPIINEEIAAAFSLASKNPDIDFVTHGGTAQLTDKSFQNSWLVSNGLPAPAIFSRAEALNRPDDVFIKPMNGTGSKGARIISKLELQALTDDEISGLMLQEICSAPEVTVDSFHDFESNRQYTYCRERIEVKSGVSTKARIFFDEEISLIAHKMARALNQNGTICFQVMKSNTGWVITDLNLRSGAGTAMTVATGNDVLAAGFAVRSKRTYQHLLHKLNSNEEYFVTRQYTDFVTQSNV